MDPKADATPAITGQPNNPEAPCSPVAPTARRRALLLGLAVVLSVVDSANTLRNQLVWDDHLQIVRNPDLRNWSGIGKAFGGPVWSSIAPHGMALSSYYRPLQATVYALVYQISGLNPASFHAANLAFHALTTAALFLLVQELIGSDGAAFGAAAFFAADPIHTEAVNWIAALPDLQCALFYLLSLYCWIRWRKTQPRGKLSRRWLAGACVAFFLALLAKEMALTLPLVVLLYEWFFGTKLVSSEARARLWMGLGGLSAALVAYVGLRAWALGGLIPGRNGHALTLGQYVLSDLALVGQYFQKVFLPLRLSAYHVFRPSASLRDPHALLGAGWAILCAVAAAMGSRWPKWLRAPIFGIVWILLTLIPVLAIGQVGYNVFAERYLYLPSAGACLAVAVLLWQLYERGRKEGLLAAACGASIVLACSIQTIARNRIWKDDFTLSQATTRASPDAAPMYNALGEVYFRRGQNAEALAAYREARDAALRGYDLNPLYLANAYSGMGTAYLAMGKAPEAEAAFDQALEDYPYPDAYLNLGVIAFQQKDYQKAFSLSQQAIQVLPVYGLAYNNAGAALLAEGETTGAIPYLERAVELMPNYTQGRMNLAIAYQRSGNIQKAVEQMRAVLSYEPGNQLAARYLERLLKVPPAGTGLPPVQN